MHDASELDTAPPHLLDAGGFDARMTDAAILDTTREVPMLLMVRLAIGADLLVASPLPGRGFVPGPLH